MSKLDKAQSIRNAIDPDRVCSNCGLSIVFRNKTGICSRSTCRVAQVSTKNKAYRDADPIANKARVQAWRDDDPIRLQDSVARSHAKRRHIDNPYKVWKQTGFTAEMHAECLEIQKGLCGLCDKALASITTRNGVHHDHVPGSNPPQPRGILCHYCNASWLGRLEAFERAGDCKITNPQILEWQTFPPMSKSSFAESLGWTRPILPKGDLTNA